MLLFSFRMIHLWDTLSHTVVWSNDVGEQAQSAAFSPDGEIIVVGTVQGKWVVLDVNTREVYGVHQGWILKNYFLVC